jgi:hypothetical protein
VNPHESLNDPYRSASIIIAHVIDGDRLGRQYRLPVRIRDFILEHHGTTLVSFFYRQAMEQQKDSDAVDDDAFRYPGPRPRSRETGIVMLADSCESTVRARKPSNRQQIADIVEEIFDLRLRDRQLDDCNLTSRDLKTIRAIFIEMLQAVFHPRINYPSPITIRQPVSESIRGAGEVPAAVTPAKSEPGALQVSVPATGSSPGSSPDLRDDEPLRDVPPLRRVSRTPADHQAANGSSQGLPQNEHPEPKPNEL